jgi:hypothetical protein
MNEYQKLVRAAKRGKGLKLTARDVQMLGEDKHVQFKAQEAGRLACARVGYHKRGRLGACPCSAFSGSVTRG